MAISRHPPLPHLRVCKVCSMLPGFGRPVLFCGGKMPRARGMAAYERDGCGASCQPKFECGFCEMLVFGMCCVRQNLYVFSLYCNPDIDDRIFDCLLSNILYQTHQLTQLHLSATSAVSSAKKQLVDLEPATIQTQQLQPFPKHPNIHLSNHIIHIYVKQSRRHHTALSQSNINGTVHSHHFPPEHMP